MNRDLKHLRLLSIFHYVVAGLTLFYACVPLCIEIGQPEMRVAADTNEVANILSLVPALMFMLGMWAIAAVTVVVGRFLARRRQYVFCLVMAAFMCMIAPFVAILGMFTLIVLLRPSVKLLFEPQAMQSPFRTSAEEELPRPINALQNGEPKKGRKP